jgi:hypothetical protein
MPTDLEFKASHTHPNNCFNLTFSFNICTSAKIILLPITKTIMYYYYYDVEKVLNFVKHKSTVFCTSSPCTPNTMSNERIYQQSIQPMEHDYIYGLYCLALTSFGLTDQLLGPK